MSLKNFLHKSSSLSDQNTTPAREIKPALTGLFEDILISGSSLRVRVTGKSMAPFLMGGEIVTLKKVPSASFRRGDLVLFRDSQGLPFLHRIIKMDRAASTVQTKGDALLRPDKPIHHNQVLGKVFMIERVPLHPGSATINMESHRWIIMNYLIATVYSIKSRIYCSLSTI